MQARQACGSSPIRDSGSPERAHAGLLQRSLASAQLAGPWKRRDVRFERANPLSAPLEPSHLCRYRPRRSRRTRLLNV